jgi:hypothetical protein
MMQGDEKHERDIAANVDRVGWSAISVCDIWPSFVYSVGLMFSLNHPELIVFGLDDEGYRVMRAMIEDIRGGRSFASPEAYDGVLVHGKIATKPVHFSQHTLYLGYAMGYCRERGRIGQLQAVQVFWPDRAGTFPFESGCEKRVRTAQPRLDLPASPDELRGLRRA